MNDLVLAVVVIVGSYLVGSVPSSYLVARYVGGIDIRDYGSGNVGASNLATHVSRMWAVPVVLYDVVAKGSLPILVASDKVFDLGMGVAVLAAIAAMVGHNWPIFLGFSGGRGVSVGIGSVGALGVPLLILWGSVPAILITMSPWKDSAVAWLLGSALLPIWAVIAGYDVWVVVFCIGFTVVTVLRRATTGSWQNALAGQEGLTMWRLLINRVVFDRDIASREAWISQRPAS